MHKYSGAALCWLKPANCAIAVCRHRQALRHRPLLGTLSDLDQVENELGAFCSTLSPEDSPEKCWQVGLQGQVLRHALLWCAAA